jgi:hypothetical protein
MKLQVLILILVVAVIVFAVTFAAMYIDFGGNPDGPSGSTADLEARVTFLTTQAPASRLDPERGPEYEWHRDEGYDFLFHNDRPEPLAVGLVTMSCKCSQVQVAVLPDAWKQQQAPVYATLVLSAGSRLPGGAQAALLAVDAQAVAFAGQEVCARLKGDLRWQAITDRPEDMGVSIPAHAAGYVRLGFKGEALGPQRLTAEVWSRSRDSGLNTRLEVPVTFVQPVQGRLDGVEAPQDPNLPDSDLHVWSLGGLPTGFDPAKRDFYVWSSTRSKFGLELEPLSGEPFIVCSAPQPLSPAECRELETRLKSAVLAGYRVQVTVRESTNGQQLPFGPFRQHIRFHVEGELKPVVLNIHGKVRGDIDVVIPDERNHREREFIDLGTFSARQGCLRPNAAALEVPDLQQWLTADRQEYDFLDVKVREGASDAALGKKTWHLDLEFRKDSGHRGHFADRSRPGSPSSECYVYLNVYPSKEAAEKAPKEPLRRIRIPVRGYVTPE